MLLLLTVREYLKFPKKGNLGEVPKAQGQIRTVRRRLREKQLINKLCLFFFNNLPS